MIVNNCKLIAKSGQCIVTDNKIIKNFDNYIKKIGGRPLDTVWYDIEDKICFSLDLNYQNSPPPETPYLTPEESFLSNPRHGLQYFKLIKETGLNLLNLEVLQGSIIEKTEKNLKFKDSTILIIGAGPSAKRLNLVSEDYDHLWVCNDFYENKDHSNIKADLHYMSADTQEKIESYDRILNDDNLMACFDINVGRKMETLRKYRDTLKERVFLFSSRIFTTVGTMPRLINLACLLGASEVKFIGMDGHSREHFAKGESFSSFELKWKNIPSAQTFGSQRREYLLFWEHIIKSYPKIKFKNLGDFYEHNVSKNILGKL